MNNKYYSKYLNSTDSKDYYSLYMKYKNKYISLKQDIENLKGGAPKCIKPGANIYIDCQN